VTVRVGVVGGGLVAQAMHLHYLAASGERFRVQALAEPSATVREALAARYGIPVAAADHRELLERSALDAVVVCSPAATHAEVVLDALAAGLHVFVEKPLCITLADVDSIVAARGLAGRVVQVGYMKRFDPAYEAMVAELPPSAESLRYVDVLVSDPEFGPYFAADEIVRGDDVPREVLAAGRRALVEQVEAAVGSAEPEVIAAFEGGFLGSLVHDVNLVHGLLEAMGEPLPGEVVGGDWWAGGAALTGSVRLANGARWDSAWIQLLDLHEYHERVTLMLADSLRTLTFPSPWLKQSPTRYERSGSDEAARVVHAVEGYEESFARELRHFHACVTEGAACRTPPEQARLDIDVLTRMFLASR
jgi:predicted dehydrogenase